MGRHDPRGVEVGTASPEALAHAERGLWRMLSFFGDPLPDLQAAAEADPRWLLPPVMKAGFLLSLTEARLRPQAEAELQRASILAPHAPQREQRLLAAVRRGWQGDWAQACALWEEALLFHPRDVLALWWAHLFDFHRGDAYELERRIARVLPEWSAQEPLFPFVLAMHAFGLEENHRHAEAESAGRRALETGVVVPWAIHAVAHVMEMQGRVEEGAHWLRSHRERWSQDNGFAVHLWWHHGLFRLERLDTEGVLRLYDEHLRPDFGGEDGGEAVQILLQRLDPIALLWRLHLLDVEVGDRWREVVRACEQAPEEPGWSPFNDLHRLLALLGAGRIDEAARWLDEVEAACARLPVQDRREAGEMGLALMRGLLAWGQGRDEDAVHALLAARAGAQRIGGSHAQRDLIDQTLIAAAARGRMAALARALVHERSTARPPSPLTHHWAGRAGVRV